LAAAGLAADGLTAAADVAVVAFADVAFAPDFALAAPGFDLSIGGCFHHGLVVVADAAPERVWMSAPALTPFAFARAFSARESARLVALDVGPESVWMLAPVGALSLTF
jgi:hypothetical protein